MGKDRGIRYPNEYNTQDNMSEFTNRNLRYTGVLDQRKIDDKERKDNKNKDKEHKDEGYLGTEFLYW
jgi:hypothetical protein